MIDEGEESVRQHIRRCTSTTVGRYRPRAMAAKTSQSAKCRILSAEVAVAEVAEVVHSALLTRNGKKQQPR